MPAIAVAFLLVTVLCSVLIVIGYVYVYAAYKLLSYREAVEQQRQQLDAAWRTLDNTQRLRAVFLDARRQMGDEARLHGMQSTPPAGGQ